FDGNFLLVPAPTPEQVHPLSGNLLASGVDHDGTTPLMVFEMAAHEELVVFHGGTITPQTSDGDFSSPEAFSWTLTHRPLGPNTMAASALSPPPEYMLDLFDGAPVVGGQALYPVSAIVFHGAIIVAGPLAVGQTATGDPPVIHYEILGWGFAINQGG